MRLIKATERELGNWLRTNRNIAKDIYIKSEDSILELNAKLSEDDLYTLISPDFFNAIYSNADIENIVDGYYMSGYGVYPREVYQALHDFYNI